MLLELHVKNLSVLAEATLELGPGLNVLTGETGAGKSLLVDSLLLLVGERPSADLIRTGSEVLTVAGVFAPADPGWREVLREAGLEADDGEGELMIRREISRSGRNRVFVNDQPATQRLLGALAPYLLRIHGQREELGLTSSELQRRWLDRSGGDAARKLQVRVADAFVAWQDLHVERASLLDDARRREERVERLTFEAREIDAVAPRERELEELAREVHLLRHASAIREALSEVFDLLVDRDEAVSAALSRSATLVEPLQEALGESSEWLRELEEIRIRAEEVGRSVLRRLEDIDSDPATLERVEDRLARLERLAKKYGPTTAEILEHRRRLGERLADLEELDLRRGEMDRRVAAARESYREAALALSSARASWGERLGEAIVRELADLALGQSRFAVRLGRRPREEGPLEIDGERIEAQEHGIDRVEFAFTPNPGEELQSLARAASGGELSRLYLALQLAVGGEEGNPSLVFDEIDAGIGGAEAAALGSKLARLAKDRQVLVVTHLPQVASHAERHFKVRKEVRNERTSTSVDPLGADERVEEIARMLAGHEVTELSLSHARELVEGAARTGAS